MAPKISAVIIAYNEEPNMRSCLESVQWADEVIVVDSYSTDATVAISREYTEHIFQHAFSGFGTQRNEAVAHATHDWIFSLDADERATVELRDEILSVLEHGPEAQAFFVPRLNYFLGRQIKRGGWYPDYRQPQLFHKSHMRYTQDLVHETYELDGRPGYLRSHVEQYPFRDIDHFLTKMDRYSTLMADTMVKQQRRFHVHQLFSHPLFTFGKMYVMRRGFLDGKPGLILAGLYAYYTFVKYAKFWEATMEHSRRQSEYP
ncbi:MAG: glycosyltransferase family 2 protein [Nitrospira sp.]|nr:glycosyltransferase family 2 protein [Nitrospira sp.]